MPADADASPSHAAGEAGGESEPASARPSLLILDANVLIDYCEADRHLLRLISIHLAPISLPITILSEVDGLSREDCAELGLELVDPPLAQLTAVAQRRGGGLSLNDRLCLVLAKERQGACVTNDGRLRAECRTENVPVIWGPEPLVQLVRDGPLTPERAVRAVSQMQRANPRYITVGIVEGFIEKIGRSA